MLLTEKLCASDFLLIPTLFINYKRYYQVNLFHLCNAGIYKE